MAIDERSAPVGLRNTSTAPTTSSVGDPMRLSPYEYKSELTRPGSAVSAEYGFANISVSSNTVPKSLPEPSGLIVGDTLLNDGNDIIISTIGATTISIASTISAGISTGDVLTFKRYVDGYDKQVYGISTSSQYVAIGYSGYAHAGWVGVTTYTDMHGTLRVKTETLVALSGITTGSDGILYPTGV